MLIIHLFRAFSQNEDQTTKTLPSTSRVIPNNKPAPPSFFSCLFAWLAPLKTRKDHLSAVDETIKANSQEKN